MSYNDNLNVFISVWRGNGESQIFGQREDSRDSNMVEQSKHFQERIWWLRIKTVDAT